MLQEYQHHYYLHLIADLVFMSAGKYDGCNYL